MDYGVTNCGNDAQTLQRVKELHPHVVRFNVPWEKIEIAPGRYDYVAMDRLVKDFRDIGVRILVTLITRNKAYNCPISSPWWSNPYKKYPHAGACPRGTSMTAYIKFIRAFLARYAGELYGLQVDNEPNNYGVYWQDTLASYAAALNAVYAQKQQMGLSLPIVAAGIANEALELLIRGTDLLSPYLKNLHYDDLDLHVYGALNTIQEKIKAIQAMGHTRLITTECSGPTWPVSNLESEKVAQLITRTAIVRSAGLKLFCWLSWQDLPNEATKFRKLGLVNSWGEPYPVFHKYKEIIGSDR